MQRGMDLALPLMIRASNEDARRKARTTHRSQREHDKLSA